MSKPRRVIRAQPKEEKEENEEEKKSKVGRSIRRFEKLKVLESEEESDESPEEIVEIEDEIGDDEEEKPVKAKTTKKAKKRKEVLIEEGGEEEDEKEENLEKKLENVNVALDLKLTKTQVKNLVKEIEKSSQPFNILIEVIEMLRGSSYEKVFSYVKEAKSPDEFFWNQEYLQSAKQNVERELLILQFEPEGTTIAGVCKFCGAEKLSVTQAQTRGGDESMTVFIRCLTCGKSWKR